VEAQLSVVCDLSNGPYRKRLGVSGIPPHNRLHTPLDAAGRPIVIPDRGIVLSKKVAEILNVGVGDSIRLRPLIARRQEVTTPVVGIVDSFLGLSAYADLGYLSRLLGEEWSANVLLADTHAAFPAEPIYGDLKVRPTVTGIGERTRSLTQLHETFGKTMGTMISIMVLFAGLIAFGSVLNAALVSLSERQREVGTLRVLGYTPLQVTGIFSGESYLLNGAGIGLGIGLGIAGAYGISLAMNTELYRFPVCIRVSNIAVTAAVILAFVTLAQISIYYLVVTLRWLDVLKIRE
jgi:putative ABC transport system permease protein